MNNLLNRSCFRHTVVCTMVQVMPLKNISNGFPQAANVLASYAQNQNTDNAILNRITTQMIWRKILEFSFLPKPKNCNCRFNLFTYSMVDDILITKGYVSYIESTEWLIHVMLATEVDIPQKRIQYKMSFDDLFISLITTLWIANTSMTSIVVHTSDGLPFETMN